MALLRNPYHNNESIALNLTPGYAGSAVSAFYPEERYYGVTDGEGRITIPLAPYETLAVKISGEAGVTGQAVYVPPLTLRVEKADIAKDDGTCSAAFAITSECSDNDLYFLVTGGAAVGLPAELSAELDGAGVGFKPCAGDDGFAATMIPKKEFWRLAKISFGTGTHEWKLRFTPPEGAKTEIFALSYKRGGDSPLPSGLPQPEYIYTDGIMI